MKHELTNKELAEYEFEHLYASCAVKEGYKKLFIRVKDKHIDYVVISDKVLTSSPSIDMAVRIYNSII